jgi:hypothetical protein
MMDRLPIKVIQRIMKLGEFYKLPLKVLKLLDTGKLSLWALKTYLQIQEYVADNGTCILYLEDFCLGNGMEKTRLLEGISYLAMLKLISYERMGDKRVAIYFEGFPHGFEFEVEI